MADVFFQYQIIVHHLDVPVCSSIYLQLWVELKLFPKCVIYVFKSGAFGKWLDHEVEGDSSLINLLRSSLAEWTARSNVQTEEVVHRAIASEGFIYSLSLSLTFSAS